jgi:hypothetical protein
MTLEQEIYQQLLELYTQDLETENLGLYLQVRAYQVNRDYTPPPQLPVQPGFIPNWPHQYPVWCTTTDTYELGSLEDAEKFAQSRYPK